MPEPLAFHIKSGKDFTVKELFKEIAGLVRDHFSGKPPPQSALDIGCASGELPYYLKGEFQMQGPVWGVDIEEKLVQNARERFGGEGLQFTLGDALNFKLDHTFDVITATSVLSCMEDYQAFLRNMLRHLSPGGIGIVSGMFNDYGMEERLTFREGKQGAWVTWYINPVQYLQEYLDTMGYKLRIKEQVMPFDLPRTEDLTRSWSIMVNGKRYNTNGLHLFWNIMIVAITGK